MHAPVPTSDRQRALLLGSASAAALALLAPATASAQESTPSVEAAPAVPTSEVDATDIIVTATRVTRAGFDAPTPTSVITAQEIQAKAPNNIADFVNDLPALAGSANPRTSVAAFAGGTGGINALNLRNLGQARTLVLLDGQRVGASTITGWVDVNNLPQALVKRVDVVTGGASASWGSDAVAGVVNFVLDKEYVGVKAEAQGGVTTYGDARTYRFSLTAGTKFAGDRGHIIVSAEAAHDDSFGLGKRDWYNAQKLFINPNYTATNGQPQLLNRPNSGVATATPGGIITSGPLRGTYFGPGGVPRQFNYGSVVGGNYMQGGDWQYSDITQFSDLAPTLSRQGIFGRASFDINDDVEIFGQFSYNRSTSRFNSLPQVNFGNVTIQTDNAFIPTGIASQVTAPFSLGTYNLDLGPKIVSTRRSTYRAVIGAKGKFDALGSAWTWDVYGQHSINHLYAGIYNGITARYAQAVDAVRNANGVIVCRSTLTNPTNGCVPYNVFGEGVNPDAAKNWIFGTSEGRTRLKQDVVAATLRGEPFSTWAGPVSIATGIEHRRESVSGSSDPISQARGFNAGNYFPSSGAYHVTEGFLEAVIPLAKDMPFAEKLDFNGAIRATDYSSSGYVTTWKAGLTYSPVNGLTFRGTRSRDIRAPNLSDLYSANVTATTTLTDPFRNNASIQTFQVTSGSTSLKPERADTYNVGVVAQPRFAPGLSLSVDYYRIKIEDAITTLAAQVSLNQCFAGNTALCSTITRNSAGTIASIGVQPINLAKQIARGIDFEASYRGDLEDAAPFLKGKFAVRLLATRFLENSFDNGINPPTDTAGTNGPNGNIGGVLPALPKWRWNASINWDNGPLAIGFTARGISAGKYDNSYIQCTSNCPASTTNNMTIEDNRIAGAVYFDANASFKFLETAQVFLAVDNIGNKAPVQSGNGPSITGSTLSTNPALYDILGRTFRLGIRFGL